MVALAQVSGPDQIDAFRKVDVGETPSFFIQRGPALKKTTCAEFPKQAREAVIKLVKERGKHITELEPLHAGR